MARLARIAPIVLAILVVVDALLAVHVVQRAPFPLRVPLGSPTAYLNVYLHVPIAWTSYVMFTISFILAIILLAKGRDDLDPYVYSFAFLGLIFAAATLVTGSAWASESWGTPWNWDPRETAVLLLFLAYIVYFAIRHSIADPERAVRLSAVYAVAAYSLVPISFIAPRIMESLHPTPREFGGFVARPEILWLFVSRVMIALFVAGLLGYLYTLRTRGIEIHYRRVLAIAGILVIVAGIGAGFYILQPYITGSVERVLDARMQGSMITALELDESGWVKLDNPQPSPITPATYNGTPTIVGHLVYLTDNGVSVVIHWSVALNLTVHMILVGGLLLYIAGIRARR